MSDAEVATAKPSLSLPQSAPDAPGSGPPGEPPASGAPSGGEQPAPSISERARFNREQAALRKMRKALPGQIAQLEAKTQAQIEAVNAELAKARADIAKRDEEIQRFRSSPIDAIEDPAAREAAIRKFAMAGTPEAKTESELAALRRELNEEREARKKFLDEQAKEKAEREEQAKQSTSAQLAQIEARAIQGFVSGVMTRTDEHGAPTYAYLQAEYTPEEIRAQAREVQEYAKELRVRDPKTGVVTKGQTYTFDEVASFLEDRAKKVYDLRKQRRETLLAARAEPVSPTVTKTGRASRVVAAVTAGPQVPPASKRPLSRRQRDKQEAAEYTAALRKAAAMDQAKAGKK